jgi:hypothetical protein
LYVAPAETAVPSNAVDGTVLVHGFTLTTLFGGVTPRNGFHVALNFWGYELPGCFVNDNGPAAQPIYPNSVGAGFFLQLIAGEQPPSFTTPIGYKPMGPVSILCNSDLWITARAW